MNLYVSFGQKYNLRNSLMKFEGKNEDQIRDYMMKVYKNKYAFIYEESEALRQVDVYGLNIVLPGEELYERVN
ncbi:TPA: hypothetical protein MCM29_005053 [Klebsiella pneumoniae]|nr:hypothetical protein vBKpMFBKp34_216 [Klebsiella phage vB_KpM_FBKp34]UYL04326.1 hypothetical protein EPNKCIFM_00005 [Klebsiella phage KP13-16]HBT0444852.1 hypothetical protein [Klebsiella pneumoniae]HBT8980314.1 hypothetical protein [Klebsiella pneumoniae]